MRSRRRESPDDSLPLLERPRDDVSDDEEPLLPESLPEPLPESLLPLLPLDRLLVPVDEVDCDVVEPDDLDVPDDDVSLLLLLLLVVVLVVVPLSLSDEDDDEELLLLRHFLPVRLLLCFATFFFLSASAAAAEGPAMPAGSSDGSKKRCRNCGEGERDGQEE